MVVAASVRTKRGQVVGDRLAPRQSCSRRAIDLVDDAVVEVVHHLADLRVGVAGDRARRHDRVVVGVHRRGAADHPLGERRGRLARLARREVVGEAVEQFARVGEDHREHRVLRVEVEVEAGPRDAGPLADGADGQVGERPLVRAVRGPRRRWRRAAGRRGCGGPRCGADSAVMAVDLRTTTRHDQNLTCVKSAIQDGDTSDNGHSHFCHQEHSDADDQHHGLPARPGEAAVHHVADH